VSTKGKYEGNVKKKKILYKNLESG